MSTDAFRLTLLVPDDANTPIVVINQHVALKLIVVTYSDRHLSPG